MMKWNERDTDEGRKREISYTVLTSPLWESKFFWVVTYFQIVKYVKNWWSYKGFTPRRKLPKTTLPWAACIRNISFINQLSVDALVRNT